MNNDPVDGANDRRNVGLHRKTEVDRGVLIHPSVGGVRGYPFWYRMANLHRAEQDLETYASLISHSRGKIIYVVYNISHLLLYIGTYARQNTCQVYI